MITFDTPRDVKLRNVQCRMEKHGEDEVPALDLAISVTGQNTMLDMIDTGLRAALFRPEQAIDGELPLGTDDLPSIRFRKLAMPLKLDHEQAGMTMKIAYGLTDDTAMVLGAVTLSKLRVVLIEGGSVELLFNLSTKDLTEKIIGKLSILQQHEISLTLAAPEVDTDNPLHPNNVKLGPWPVTNSTEPPPLTPEDVFISSATTAE
jgi:hypothetical protein